MSSEAIENTIRAMRDRNAVAYLRRGILGNVSVNAGRRAEDICEMFAGRVEADVADILAENERLRAALKQVLNEIDIIEKMPTANLDGSFANQKINGERLIAKIAFFQKVKKIVKEAHNV